MIQKLYTWFLIGLLVIFFLFAFHTFFGIEVYGADKKKYLQQSSIDPRKEVIHSADGKSKGYLQQSPIDPKKTVQHDKNGSIKGTWQKSYIDPRKIVFIEKE